MDGRKLKTRRCNLCSSPYIPEADLKAHPDPVRYPNSQQQALYCDNCMSHTHAEDKLTRARWIANGTVKPRDPNNVR